MCGSCPVTSAAIGRTIECVSAANEAAYAHDGYSRAFSMALLWPSRPGQLSTIGLMATSGKVQAAALRHEAARLPNSFMNIQHITADAKFLGVPSRAEEPRPVI